jgi:hypothetical protein
MSGGDSHRRKKQRKSTILLRHEKDQNIEKRNRPTTVVHVDSDLFELSTNYGHYEMHGMRDRLV